MLKAPQTKTTVVRVLLVAVPRDTDIVQDIHCTVLIDIFWEKQCCAVRLIRNYVVPLLDSRHGTVLCADCALLWRRIWARTGELAVQGLVP